MHRFRKNSFINRNKIKTSQGPQWLTIPIKTKGHFNSTLIDTEVDNSQNWRVKHLKSIEMNYRKAPYFDQNYPKLVELLSTDINGLAELCWRQLNFWLSEFDIGTKVVRLSELDVNSKKSNLVLDLCVQFSADEYYSGALGRDYLDENNFLEKGISIKYQEFFHPVYPQQRDNFEPYMGIIDYWMNCGSGKLKLIEGISDGL